MSTEQSFIRVKAMLVAPNHDLTAHAVTLNPPTRENPGGYHRLVGGSVEFGESHRDAIVREVREELGATILDLVLLGSVESIFLADGVPGHEIVFVYSGRLDPQPAATDATVTESDGSVLPVVWRSFDEARESVPVYPAAVVSWIRSLAGRRQLASGGPGLPGTDNRRPTAGGWA